MTEQVYIHISGDGGGVGLGTGVLMGGMLA